MRYTAPRGLPTPVTRFVTLCFLYVAVLSTPAHADDEPAAEAVPDTTTPEATDPPPVLMPRDRIVYSNFMAIRVNPLGLVDRLRIGWRHRLYDRPGILFEKAYLDLGMETTLAPTYGALGARLEFQPLAILNLSATYEFLGYFGELGAVMPVQGRNADWWEDTLRERGRDGENYATYGSRLTLAGVLQGKAGPIIIRNTVTGLRVDLKLRDGATMSYDATQDLVLPDGGWAVINDLDVGASVSKALFGVRYTYADALHGTGGTVDQPTHRVGPLFAWTFKDKPYGARYNGRRSWRSFSGTPRTPGAPATARPPPTR